MASSQEAPPNNAPSCKAWKSLVRRSLEAWNAPDERRQAMAEKPLQRYIDLDDFLAKYASRDTPMFWFFQRREAFLSQKNMTKWSRDRLDDYVLFPIIDGFILRRECFFVSHFWHTRKDPDPDGKYLKLMQRYLKIQSWSYIWVDWTCLPQEPWGQNEKAYFLRALQTTPAIIRNCAFMWYYSAFKPSMWVLFEVAVYYLTCERACLHTEDIEKFKEHVNEMLQIGVRPTLSKHGYNCKYDRDKDFLTAWLELLVLLYGLIIDIDDVRWILESLTCYPDAAEMLIGTLDGQVTLKPCEGALVLGGKHYTFTPIPQWGNGEDSENNTSVDTETQQVPRMGDCMDGTEQEEVRGGVVRHRTTRVVRNLK